MQALRKIQLIQGGMGIYVSSWRLARSVAEERPGITAGTVSGSAIDTVLVRQLQRGDPGGHYRRALYALDEKFGTKCGANILQRYFIKGGKASQERYKSSPMHLLRTLDGTRKIPLKESPSHKIPLKLSPDVLELLVVSGFAEVWLAKQGHDGCIFMNFLKKIEPPLLPVMYGAMLADVDGIVVGAGNPDGLPEIRSKLVNHETVALPLSILYRASGEEYMLPFDPKELVSGKFTEQKLRKPVFLAIVSKEDLALTLSMSTSEAPDGLIIENHTAGGHNANPAGVMKLDHCGQPIYGQNDQADLDEITKIGLPFWLAGGYSSREQLHHALDMGATGIQVGSVFALTAESGMNLDLRCAILKKIKHNSDDTELVRTTMVSPTGFSFKVAQLEGTLSESTVYQDRRRTCNIGLLLQWGITKPGENGERQIFHRCPAGPVDHFLKNRGLQRNSDERRCLCNGLMATVGLGQITRDQQGNLMEEPAIITLGEDIDGIRRLSRSGQTDYWVKDVVRDILGELDRS